MEYSIYKKVWERIWCHKLTQVSQFYLEIPKCATLWRVSWSIIKIVLPIKDINRRNYYFSLSVEQNLSVRQFYLLFSKLAPVAQLSWTNITILLPIKNENKRNYYINLCIERKLSKRQLLEEIKASNYERLINKPINVEIIIPRKEYTILEDIKNPIIIKVDKNKIIKSEKDLELTILSEITFVLTQLGRGFAFIGNQYKINNYYIDILLFNIELNS